MNEKFIIFEGAIDQQATTQLAQAIEAFVKKGAQKITILFSSLGGNIYEGFLLATIIQNSKVPINIHATNHIDSIANVIYLAAKERSAESHVKFYLHGASVQGNFDEKGLREKLLELKTQNSRIAAFITENSSVLTKKIRYMMRVGTTLSAKDAHKLKIVQTICHKEIPPEAERIDVIYIN